MNTLSPASPPDAAQPPEGAPAAGVKINKRRENRIAAMQYLYAWEVSRPENQAESLRLFFTSQERDRAHYAFAEELVNGILEHITETDEAVRSYTQNWAFDRIAKVDLAILRLAIYELLHRRDIPPVVTINEAIELAKTFSAEDSKRFINGILDRIRSQLSRPSREAVSN
ncbi:MAG: transcription antitermination factor NusB [Puniceicoccales bacterium]|jgi:N utilization substance protein B|nr:transcription antitermination factor NusB [Puniceicoccales bacterium]